MDETKSPPFPGQTPGPEPSTEPAQGSTTTLPGGYWDVSAASVPGVLDDLPAVDQPEPPVLSPPRRRWYRRWFRCPRWPLRSLLWTLILWVGIPAMAAQAVLAIVVGSDRLVDYLRDNRVPDVVRLRFVQVPGIAAGAGLLLLLLYLFVRFRRRIRVLPEAATAADATLAGLPRDEVSAATETEPPLPPVEVEVPALAVTPPPYPLYPTPVPIPIPVTPMPVTPYPAIVDGPAALTDPSVSSLDGVLFPGGVEAPAPSPDQADGQAKKKKEKRITVKGERPTFRTRLHRAKRAAYFLSPLLLAPALVYLCDWRTLEGQKVMQLTVILMVAALFERTVRLSVGNREPGQGRFARFLALPSAWQGATLLGLMFLAAVGYMGYFVILNHYRFQTAAYDLGIFDNMMWQLTRGSWFRSSPAYGQPNLTHITRHANFIAVFFAPFYLIKQRADGLLALQTILALSACIPIYKLARRRLESTWMALAFAYAYLVYAPLHGAMFYDFHFLTTAPAFVAWTIYFFDTGRRWPFIVLGILTLLVREDVSPGLALMALYFFLSGKRPKAALWGGIVAMAYFVLTKFVVMPLHSSPEDRSTFTYLFQRLIPEGKDGFGVILQTIFMNTVFTLSTLLKEEKVIYLLQVLVPVMFLPFRDRKAWLPLMASILFTLFPSDPPLFSITFQYTSHYSSYVFIGSILVLSDWKRDPRVTRGRLWGAVAGICVASTLVSYHYGAMFQRRTFRGGFRQVQFEYTSGDREQRREFLTLANQIPKNASVAATETEVPHLSNRKRCYTMRVGVFDADYILVRLDEVRGDSDARRRFLDGIRNKDYSFVAREGRFALWVRGGDHAKDQEGLREVNAENLYQ